MPKPTNEKVSNVKIWWTTFGFGWNQVKSSSDSWWSCNVARKCWAFRKEDGWARNETSKVSPSPRIEGEGPKALNDGQVKLKDQGDKLIVGNKGGITKANLEIRVFCELKVREEHYYCKFHHILDDVLAFYGV